MFSSDCEDSFTSGNLSLSPYVTAELLTGNALAIFEERFRFFRQFRFR